MSDVDRSMLKISIVIFMVVLFAGLTGYFFHRGEIIYSFVSGILFLIIFILQNLFIKGFDKLFLAVLLASGFMALPFYRSFSGYFIIVVAFLFTLLFKASFDSRKELEATVKIRFLKISHLSLELAMPAVILFLLVMFIMEGNAFTEEKIGVALKPFTPLITKYVPTFNPTMPAGELLNDLVVSNLGKQEIEELNKLPLWAQDQLISKSMEQFKERIENLIGAKIDVEKSVAGNIYDALRSGYANLTYVSKVILVIISFVLLYSLIKSLTSLIFAPISLLAFILYEILLASNFFVIQLESRSREVILLK